MNEVLVAIGGLPTTTLHHPYLPDKLRHWLIDNVEAKTIDGSVRIYATDVIRDVLLTADGDPHSSVKLTSKHKTLLAALQSEYDYIELDV